MRSPWLYGLLAILPVPVLFFSSHVPAWAPVVALLWLAGVLILRSAIMHRWLSHTPADLILLGLVALLPLGLWASPDRSVTLPRTYALLADIALFYALAFQAENRALRWAGWLVLLAGLALTIAVVPGVHFYSGQKLPFIERSIYEFLPSGLKLPGDENGFNPNMAGGLLAIFLPPALALSLRAQNWGQRILAAFTFLTLFVAVLLTQSRGATLGVLVAIAVVTGLMYRSLRWLWWAAGVLMLGFLAVRGDVVVGFLSDAEATGGVHSLAQRAELWSRAIYAGQDFAFTGIGLGSFPAVIALLYPAFQVIITADVPHAHNVYLQALAEMGYPGLILYLAFFITLFFVLLRRVRLAAGWRRSLAVGLLGSLVVVLVHGLVDVPMYSPISAIVFWGMFGLMMAVGLADDHTLPAEAPRHD